MPFADRDGAGRRRYDETILRWIEFLGRLKSTGMPIREMREYADLRANAGETALERRALLSRHRDRVREKIADLKSCLAVLDSKIDGTVNCSPPLPSAPITADARRKGGAKALRRRSA